ncbi:hypothetical protein B296_00037566 [Ensete ventricosum]|uniref:Uncharacterized protein n=1 Tax=Ensete ventricosum TaxID=4639 RepID=A0A426XCF2_ENSVE|nr:hypothetical protein B296_00037566 [Ensete ventricosum]
MCSTLSRPAVALQPLLPSVADHEINVRNRGLFTRLLGYPSLKPEQLHELCSHRYKNKHSRKTETRDLGGDLIFLMPLSEQGAYRTLIQTFVANPNQNPINIVIDASRTNHVEPS